MSGEEDKKTITTTIIFPRDMYDQIKLHSEAIGIPVASWVKTVVHEKLQSLSGK